MFAKSSIKPSAAIAAGFAVLACYGPLMLIAGLGLAGIALSFNETVWAGAIAGFALLSAILLARQTSRLPVGLIGWAGAGLVLLSLYGESAFPLPAPRLIEAGGFVLLLAAAFVGRR